VQSDRQKWKERISSVFRVLRKTTRRSTTYKKKKKKIALFFARKSLKL